MCRGHAGYRADRYRQVLSALMAIAGLVLLIACANFANRLLARASTRQRDLSMRIEVGASQINPMTAFRLE